MIRIVSEKIVDLLMLHAGVKTDRDVYIYGLECFISELIGNLCLFIFAAFLGKLDEMLVWTISFLAIRTQLGGYHCSNHFRCLLFSTLLGISGMFLNTLWFRFPMLAFMIIFFCFLFIRKYAPIIHKNHPLSKSQRRHSKKYGIINFCAISFIAIILAVFKVSLYSSLCSGIILATLLGCMQVILNKLEMDKDFN